MDLKNPTPPGGPGRSAEPEIAQAKALLAQGDDAAAHRLLAGLVERDPPDVEALNLVASIALRGGRADDARQALDRALAADPDNVVTLTNLGLAHGAANDWEAAARAYRQALDRRPDLYVAQLHYGESLERIGRTGQALLAYMNAIKQAQAQGRWLNAATTGAGLRPAVERAVQFVRRGQRELFEDLLVPLRQQHGPRALKRVEDCLAVYLGEQRPEFPDPRQRPTFLYFPGLPPRPYFPRELFPWIEAYEASAGDMRAELQTRLAAREGREAVFHRPDVAAENLRNDGGIPAQWDGYYFYRHGERRDQNCAACPRTAAALERLPLARVPRHGPEAMFSVLEAGTHLLPHRGVTNTRLVLHLPLIVPEKCALNVAGQLHEWREGRAVVFDDTYEHEAWNRSGETRVVLIADIWNPHLTEVERAAVSELVVAMGDLREAVDGSRPAVSGH